ncbi:hypothetical protein P5G51_006045 [Virgibacillus sp. 179-BFC.A HS]|uniref:Uncharacterized protein n=1 Tax=Tigheibacillus jepli TaxID=3035914 RepID=A0ABU5CFB0_9BACI|nr:hypothetical protein [Virgibacillus sp. 179-BFC.A HS]MDY0405018.1 hypothetical protein [Virgibacillus sp. 179-BFC.A HS]
MHTKETLATLENDLDVHEQAMNDMLEDLQADAQDADFSDHALNEHDFNRNRKELFDFTVWKQETEKHYEKLEKAGEQLRTYEQLKNQVIDFQKRIADVNQEMDKSRQEEKDWLQIFENDKQEKLSEIYQWTKQFDFFRVEEAILQGTARKMDVLYEKIHMRIFADLSFKSTRIFKCESMNRLPTKKVS